MSTILKALRRLEQEKSAHAQRPLREEVATETSEARRRVPLGVAVGGVFAAGIVLGGAALLLWPRSALTGSETVRASPVARPTPARPAPPPLQVATAPPPARVTAPPPVAAPERTRPDLTVGALKSPVEVVKLPEQESTPDPATAEPPPRPPRLGEVRPGEVAMRPRQATAPVPPVPALAPRSTPPAPTAASAEPKTRAPEPTATMASVPEITPKEPARPRPAPAVATPPVPPKREASPPPPAPVPAPAVAKAPAPSISVERTHWHPLPERRLAIVDVSGHEEPLRLHEGDEVGPLRVAKIEPSGVVFVQDGVEVRHAVGH